MSDYLPTEIGDPISQSGVVRGDNGTSSFATRSESTSESGDSPLLYFTIIWAILLVLIGALVTLLSLRKRRTGQHELPSMANEVQEEAVLKEQKMEAFTKLAILNILITGAAMGLALSIFAILSCDFLHLSETLTVDWIRTENGDVISVEFYSLGLWAFGLESDPGIMSDGNSDSCFEIANFIPLGWQFNLARASAVIASLLGGLTLLILLVGCASNSRRSIFRFLAWPLLLATFFQSLTLVMFQTHYCTSILDDRNCSVSVGGLAAITASLYWLFCAVAALSSFPKNS